MIKYSIEGGNLPVVICHLEAGQSVCTETGAMSWMTPNIKMDAKTGGGLKKMFGRLVTGDSLFMNEYTAVGGTGMIAFSSSFPGSIIPYQVSPGNSLIVQKGAFLAMEKGLNLSIHIQRKIGKGLFGGEGFIMQKISGTGIAFLEIDGYCKEYRLGVGQSLIVDTGYLAAMTESCSIDIQPVKGAKNVFLGGEGLFHTKVTGPGTVYLQSMPIFNTAQALSPYLNIGNPDGDGGINIRLGD